MTAVSAPSYRQYIMASFFVVCYYFYETCMCRNHFNEVIFLFCILFGVHALLTYLRQLKQLILHVLSTNSTARSLTETSWDKNLQQLAEYCPKALSYKIDYSYKSSGSDLLKS